MATLHKHGNRKLIFVKGAPERVLDMCSEDIHGREVNKKEILHFASEFAKEGRRVLAFAYKEAPDGLEDLTCKELEKRDVADLIFAGLQRMIDPPRAEAIEAIEGCKRAGIKVVMITGDHAVTARAIARKLGITDEDGVVLTGREIEEMKDEDLFEKVKTVNVYARVSPRHKLRITRH